MTESLNNSKSSLRQQVRARLKAMTSAKREAASREICSWLRQQAVWQSAGAILFFAPMADEPDIWPLMEECLAAGKTVGLPRFAAERSGYVAGQVRDLARDIRLGKFQIREPSVDCPELELSQFDLILTPGVAFDHKGRRLGRGQGYYDRWLKDARRATLCGVAFAEQWLEEIPAEDHDITMHLVVTQTGVFRCGK
jgi:5-formyltetrahydrofolate cyclo-ligase